MVCEAPRGVYNGFPRPRDGSKREKLFFFFFLCLMATKGKEKKRRVGLCKIYWPPFIESAAISSPSFRWTVTPPWHRLQINWVALLLTRNEGTRRYGPRDSNQNWPCLIVETAAPGTESAAHIFSGFNFGKNFVINIQRMCAHASGCGHDRFGRTCSLGSFFFSFQWKNYTGPASHANPSKVENPLERPRLSSLTAADE